MLAGYLLSVRDVAHYVGSALNGGKVLVIRVVVVVGAADKAFILYETQRIANFPYIMIQGAGPHQVGVHIIYASGHKVSHIHHLERVLESAGGLLLERAYQRIGHIAKLA